HFPWFEAPPGDAVQQAERLLRVLGATDARGLTALGRRMSRLPAQPRVARLMCESSRFGHLDRLALAGALLSERDPLLRSGEPQPVLRHWSHSDVLDRVAAIEEFERGGRRAGSSAGIDKNAAHQVLQARDQLRRLLAEEHADRANSTDDKANV